MSFYLDPSAILPALVTEEKSEIVENFLAGCTQNLIVGDFAAAEVASAFSRLVRMRRLAAEEAQQMLRNFDSWRAQVTTTTDIVNADMRLTEIFVRRFDCMLRAPDALHAAICRRIGATLVTLDRKLAESALSLGIPTMVPGD